MEQAIKIAIENGWKPEQDAQFVMFTNPEPPTKQLRVQIADHFTLDPLFWQALGKGLGWGTYDTGKLTTSGNRLIGEVSLRNWHLFIQHLWEGKDINSFFDELCAL